MPGVKNTIMAEVNQGVTSRDTLKAKQVGYLVPPADVRAHFNSAGEGLPQSIGSLQRESSVQSGIHAPAMTNAASSPSTTPISTVMGQVTTYIAQQTEQNKPAESQSVRPAAWPMPASEASIGTKGSEYAAGGTGVGSSEGLEHRSSHIWDARLNK
jgi:hypothetical protein